MGSEETQLKLNLHQLGVLQAQGSPDSIYYAKEGAPGAAWKLVLSSEHDVF